MKHYRVYLQDPINRHITGSLVVFADKMEKLPIGKRSQMFWVFSHNGTTVATITNIMVAKIVLEYTL